METLPPPPSSAKVTLLALLLGGLAAVLLFSLSFIAGLNIAADPGSIDTGLLAVLLAPAYALAATLTGAAVGFSALRRPPAVLVGRAKQAGWRDWLAPLAIAVAAGLVILYVIMSAAERVGQSTGWAQVLAVLCTPAYVLLASVAGLAVFRLLRKRAT